MHFICVTLCNMTLFWKYVFCWSFDIKHNFELTLYQHYMLIGLPCHFCVIYHLKSKCLINYFCSQDRFTKENTLSENAILYFHYSTSKFKHPNNTQQQWKMQQLFIVWSKIWSNEHVSLITRVTCSELPYFFQYPITRIWMELECQGPLLCIIAHVTRKG